ncbi:DUF3347 domain-containing protein [Chitinophaga pinensis]|uniref:DUF3347 domain-containing protein n=1 Tax=Chitinophaga pinensis (strain ATCC 43595 / DSM 2588 / LMG 13176 / NBRC 15968 / NCIMB 11800 / UQM 2034) TaxID=485918 RepID=A0A979GTL7_CHIPD|nr:DUF3347 domain-containing protein [Chitinophaga pinensis]ACU59976.1 hypothetical protein Cpin_2488 [Chitinophaga pinensis DSM 2588]
MRKLLLLLLALAPFTILSAQNKRAIKHNQSLSVAYLAIKDGLVKNDSIAVKKAAIAMTAALEEFKPAGMKAYSQQTFDATKTRLLADVTSMAGTQNVNKQRKYFAGCSEAFWQLTGIIPMYKSTFYYQQCPMTGVTWVSNTDEIKNPYYPKNMLTCGKVIGEHTVSL